MRTMIAFLLSASAAAACISAPPIESDTDREVQKIIDESRRILRIPELHAERGGFQGDLIEEKMEAVLAEADFATMEAQHIARLADAGVLRFSPEHSRRAIERLDTLAIGDDVASAVAAITRVVLLNQSGTGDEDEVAKSIRTAIKHPWFGTALHEFDHPSRVLVHLSRGFFMEEIAPDLLEHATTFPLDAPVELVINGLPSYYASLQVPFSERTAEVEEVRRRFVKVAAGALSALDDDETVVAHIQRLNPRLDSEEIDAHRIESLRRERLQRVQKALSWLVSPRARGTLVGHSLPMVHFRWARRARHDSDGGPLRDTGDLHERPALILPAPLPAITEAQGTPPQREMQMLQKIVERYRQHPVTFLALTAPMMGSLSTGPGAGEKTCQDAAEAINEVCEGGFVRFAVALVDDPFTADLGFRTWFEPILVDHEGKVVEASINIYRTDDLTERINELLSEAGYDGDLPATERRIVVGEPAPDIAFNWASEGIDARSLEELRGRVVVLEFWTTWCGPCIASFPQMRALREKFAEEDVVFLGVTSLQGKHYPPGDEPIVTEGDPEREYELMEEFMQQKDMTWHVAFSEQDALNPEYGVNGIGIPSAFIIDQQGILRTPRLHPGAEHAGIEQTIRTLLETSDDATGGKGPEEE